MTKLADINRTEKRRAVVQRYKRLKGCIDCGYKDNPTALEFDHVNGNKRNTVASLMHHSWLTIKAEISKCVVRCANCHAIRTHAAVSQR